MKPPVSPLPLALAALAAMLAFWLLSWLTVATWLAQDARQRDADWAAGLSPWHWDFSRANSIVQPGSQGLVSWRHHADGLSLSLPDEGSITLSLALHGEHIALQAVSHARIQLHVSAPARLYLLPALPRPQQPWAQAELAPGAHQLNLPLAALPEANSPALLLRIESEPASALHLHQLALTTSPCNRDVADCPAHHITAPRFAIPEGLLVYRDSISRETPARHIEIPGIFGRTGHWLAARLHGGGEMLLRPLAFGLLILVILACIRRLQGQRSPSPRRAALELALPVGGALLLLLAGWPARDTPLPAALVFGLCLAALALLPPPSREWQWLGDAHAWKTSLGLTALIALLLAPLLWLEHPPAPTRDALHFLRYPFWALLQQWLLIAVIAPRLRLLMPDVRSTAVACGFVFALMHAPNFALMVFTFLGGSLWAALALQHRALLPLATSHTALGLWLIHIAPGWLLRSAEIGGRYLI